MNISDAMTRRERKGNKSSGSGITKYAAECKTKEDRTWETDSLDLAQTVVIT